MCAAQPGISDVRTDGTDASRSPPTRRRSRELSQALVEAGALIRALAPQTVTLEDLFFSFTEGDGGRRPRRRSRARRARSPT